MKCIFLSDMHVDHETFPPDQITPDNMTFKDRIVHGTGKKVKDMYLKAGFPYETPEAARFVRMGAAVPGDDECEALCSDIPPAEMARRQKEYQATALGIHEEEDRELFKKDVIGGYEKLPDGSMAYIKGKMWDAYFGADKDLAVPVRKDNGI